MLPFKSMNIPFSLVAITQVCTQSFSLTFSKQFLGMVSDYWAGELGS